MKTLSSMLILMFLLAPGAWAAEQTPQQELIQDAQYVMEEIMSSPDLEIPSGLISKAKAIIIFPTMLKGGFFVGARYGKGVAIVRNSKNGYWGPPSFITTMGGSFGFQFGAQAVDLILVVMSERGIKGLLEDNFTLGGDIAVAAGPVGRHAELGVDIMLQGDMYSYSRSKGIFGGVSLKGTVIKPNWVYNEEYYRKKLTPEEIMMEGKLKKIPMSSARLLKYMNKMSPPRVPEVEEMHYKSWRDDPKYGLKKPRVMARNQVSPAPPAYPVAPRKTVPRPAPKTRKPESSGPLW